MNNLIGIVNYGTAGNIHSIKKAIKKADGDLILLNQPSDFNKVDRLVIPGVGSFKDAMKELNENNFIDVLLNFKKPILGICLGMQIMANSGFEYGKKKGLGFLNAEVQKINCTKKIPHVGFNTIDVVNTNKLFSEIEDEEFYFMHSYEIKSNENILSLTKYGDYEFISSISKDNYFGVQFHPEKSRDAGIKLFKNFMEL